MKKITVILIFSAISITNLLAQERNDVIAAYNEGAKAMQTDTQAAIKAFENVITLSDKVGENANDLKQKAMQVLPGLYNKAALAALNEKKPAQETIKTAKAAVATAEKYGNATHKSNAGKILVQAYNNLATDFFSQNDYENDLLTFDSLFLINPGYINEIYNKALISIKQNNDTSFEETIDLFISKLEPGKDDEKIKQASTMALEYFRSSGSRANQAEN